MEIWRDVSGYEGLYAVSNLGRVCSWHNGKPRMLVVFDRHGYRCVGLHKDKHRYSCGVHRLVATAFIPNPNFLPMVNHKDEDPTNNTVENLEWCDSKYNINYGTRTARVSRKAIARDGKPVIQLTKDGTFIAEFECINTAARSTGLSRKKISAVCHGDKRHVTHGGFMWRFKEA